MDALLNIGRTIRIKDKRFSYAGIKDKRGITTQRVSAYKVMPEHISMVNATGGPLRLMAVGDFEFKQHPLRPGELQGNDFDVSGLWSSSPRTMPVGY